MQQACAIAPTITASEAGKRTLEPFCSGKTSDDVALPPSDTDKGIDVSGRVRQVVDMPVRHLVRLHIMSKPDSDSASSVRIPRINIPA